MKLLTMNILPLTRLSVVIGLYLTLCPLWNTVSAQDQLDTTRLVLMMPDQAGDSLHLPQASALPADTLWQQAIRLYQANEYLAAIERYMQLMDRGLESPSLYYNTGNAFFKCNDIKNAILYNERALRLAPRDENIRHNLEMANSMITDKIEAVDELFLVTWFHALRDLLTVRQWAWTSIVSFLLMLAAALVFLLCRTGGVRQFAFTLCCIALLVSAGAFVGAFYRYRYVTNTSEAIIFAPSVTLKSSPDNNGTNLFILHEGTKVVIGDRIGEWCEVRIRDGNRGWIKRSDLEII